MGLVLAIGLPLLIAMVILVMVMVGGSSALALGGKLAQIVGITKQDLGFLKNVNPKLIKEAKRKEGQTIYAALDCSNYPPSRRKPGVNCIQGLLASIEAKTQGPVPQRAEYLVPIWQAAGARYNVPWQLIAAVNAARTDFGWIDCNGRHGDGFFRIEDGAWQKYATHGGYTPLQSAGLGCFQVPTKVTSGSTSSDTTVPSTQGPATHTGGRKGGKATRAKAKSGVAKAGAHTTVTVPVTSATGGASSPVQILQMGPLKKLGDDHPPTPKGADTYNPVDASFTTARMLAANGAFKAKDWNYSGSPSNACSTAPDDGRVWYLPQTGLAGFGSGGELGYNSKLQIPRWAVLLAAKWRSNKGPLTPRQQGSALDQKLPNPVMPKADVRKLLTVAWEAFGVRGQELASNVTKNMKQTWLEVGDEPYLMQNVNLIDGNQNDPAGGMFGFIPETFKFWHVDGFNDRFNALDDILAAVNAQVNGPHTILDGSSGWSVPLSHNPYTTGGKTTVIGSSSGQSGKPVALHPYEGKAQTDRVSRAVAYQQPHGTNSDCYVAVVHDWYAAIKSHPPPGVMLDGGPIRDRIVALLRQELAKNVTERCGVNVPCYPDHTIAPYEFPGGANAPWCAAFASWIWYTAGIHQLTSVPGVSDHAGLTLPVGTQALADWGEQNDLVDPKPQPGDIIIYAGYSHTGVVETVSSSGQLLTSIEGNWADSVSRVTNGERDSVMEFISPPDAAPTSGAGGGTVTSTGAYSQDLAYVQAASARYKVPVWIEWGIAGAESTWGKGGSNLFGLLAAAGGVNVSDWQEASMQSAKTMAGLKAQDGSWGAAMKAYSGGDYGLAHVKQLAQQGPS